MAEEYYYVLYSKSRNIFYINDKDHTKFWSLYLRFKFPKDIWMQFKDNEFRYLETTREARELKTNHTISLIDPSDREGRELKSEIYDSLEMCAINNLNILTFVVTRSIRDECAVIYAGNDKKEATQKFSSTNHSTLEVWKNGRYEGLFFEVGDFQQKFA